MVWIDRAFLVLHYACALSFELFICRATNVAEKVIDDAKGTWGHKDFKV